MLCYHTNSVSLCSVIILIQFHCVLLSYWFSFTVFCYHINSVSLCSAIILIHFFTVLCYHTNSVSLCSVIILILFYCVLVSNKFSFTVHCYHINSVLLCSLTYMSLPSYLSSFQEIKKTVIIINFVKCLVLLSPWLNISTINTVYCCHLDWTSPPLALCIVVTLTEHLHH